MSYAGVAAGAGGCSCAVGGTGGAASAKAGSGTAPTGGDTDDAPGCGTWACEPSVTGVTGACSAPPAAVTVPCAGVAAGCWTGGAGAQGPGSPYGGVLYGSGSCSGLGRPASDVPSAAGTEPVPAWGRDPASTAGAACRSQSP